jgi:hypothetical protein
VETVQIPSALVHGIIFQARKVAIPEVVDVEKLPLEDYDVLVVYAESIFAYLQNLEKAKTKTVLWFLSSPHQILLPTYKDFFSKNHVDLIIKSVDKENMTEFGEAFVALGLRTKWLPLSVDADRFRNLALPKVADICILGNMNPFVYPLRLKALQYLLNGKHSVISRPCYGDDYVKAINVSRIFLTCSGTHKYPVMKYFEAMACGTLLLADEPLDADELGFKKGENYALLDDLFAIEYYLSHREEAEYIAGKGETLVRAKHSDKVRAQELYRMLASL